MGPLGSRVRGNDRRESGNDMWRGGNNPSETRLSRASRKEIGSFPTRGGIDYSSKAADIIAK